MGQIIKPAGGFTPWTKVNGNLTNLPGNQLTLADAGVFQYTLIDTDTYFFTHWFNLNQGIAGPPASISDKWRVIPFGPTVALSIDYGYLNCNSNNTYTNEGLIWQFITPFELEYQLNFTSGLAQMTFCFTAIITKV